MKAYKNYVNEETMKIDIVEFDIDGEFDFSHDPDTNLYDSDGNHNTHEKNIINSTEKLNTAIANGVCSLIKCKDCNRYFILTKDEKDWFNDRDFTLPKRCHKCRNKKKKGFNYADQDTLMSDT